MAFPCNADREMPALKQSSPSTASKGASLGKVPSTVTYSTLPSNFRHQTLVYPVLIYFLKSVLYSYISMCFATCAIYDFVEK